MHDKTLPPSSGETPAAGRLAATYLLHSAVLEVSSRTAPPDEALLGKLVRRRLSRLERVLSTHGGSLVRETPHGLLAAFDSAETAVLVACEMQRRCAVIPQISETRIGLKIGIHAATPMNETNDALDVAEIEASRLANMLGEGSVVVSGPVVIALPEILRENTAVLGRENIGAAAHLVDWAAIPMRPALAPPPANSRLVLRNGGRSYRFDGEKSVITIGRAPDNDIVISAPNASRQHCRIIYRLDNHVLVDLSMNGTYLKSDDAPEEIVRKSMVTLSGRGRIGFGHSCLKDKEQIFEFEVS
ncbi:MAG: FHA domain-containing protein [Azonexaceae bacterium]|nr:FHA domain-containing protein [Azonexaceae bacterium]